MTFYIPQGDWPLDYEAIFAFFIKLGYTPIEEGGDFLVLPGGTDLNVRPNRDAFEIACFDEYNAKGLPIIGLCRGFQLSVIRQGGLILHNIPSINYIKHTTVTGGWMGKSSWHKTSLGFQTNTRHHQGFLGLPHGWKVLDITPDGIIEAGAHENIFGVQWHPEREEMIKTKADEWFVETLKKHLNR